MTTNQIAYWTLQEQKRSNQTKEIETNRSNLANEKETNRSNLAKEDYNNRNLLEAARHNVVTEQETERHNRKGENETQRHNVITENQNQYNNRSNRMAAIGRVNQGVAAMYNARVNMIDKGLNQFKDTVSWYQNTMGIHPDQVIKIGTGLANAMK